MAGWCGVAGTMTVLAACLEFCFLLLAGRVCVEGKPWKESLPGQLEATPDAVPAKYPTDRRAEKGGNTHTQSYTHPESKIE